MAPTRALGRLAIVALTSLGVLAGCGDDAGAPPLTSEEVLTRGPFAVAHEYFDLVDASRPTPPNDSDPGAPTRTLKTNLWYPLAAAGGPAAAPGRHPVILYSHGFMSWGTEGRYLDEHLASHGYIVISPDFPLTNILAPGGPDVNDVVNQPADVRFLLDALLGFDRQPEHPLFGAVDAERVGAAGVSLGGMTTSLVTYHATLRDPRIRAAISIAGPGSMFDASFYATTDAPFLMIAGDIDAIVDYPSNALVAREMAGAKGTLVTLHGATHTGFANQSSEFMGAMDNPDNLGCAALTTQLEVDDVDFTALLGGAGAGIVERETPLPCSVSPLPTSIRPWRQHDLVILAAASFFESHLGESAAERSRAARFLRTTLAAENPEASVD